MNACSRDYYAVEMCSRTLPRPYFTSVNWHTFSYFFLLLLPLFYHCSENMPTRYKKPSRSHFIKMFNFLILLFFFQISSLCRLLCLALLLCYCPIYMNSTFLSCWRLCLRRCHVFQLTSNGIAKV